ncbi:KGGVGR-motif variant AAA ATPase [Sphaerotilus montanus]|uniref:KGGVGR-motif variant AAA ATPase n=1 Tax=Sphaerotilus montanus TaxID=522889 RepID=UPI003FA25095
MATIHFNDALRRAALSLRGAGLPDEPKARVIRDVYGRLRFALDCPLTDYPAEALTKLQRFQSALGPYATNAEVLSHDSFSDPGAVFGSADWHRTLVELGADEDGEPLGTAEIQLLDRQITGQDWLRPPLEGGTAHPHRFVFFGLKGGVGRSTALCMTAWGLAKRGKRVLLIDFDLESPGLSGLVLPANKGADFGVVDWLLEDAVGQGDEILPRMVSASPLAETTIDAIRVAAAMGVGELDYLAKLSRAYADVPSASGPKRMGVRMRTMVERLEAQEKPDVVLIDSRAGLHDLAAVSITSLADTALLFATGGAQSWTGYRQLFSHWQHRPDVAKHVRERLVIVRALTPKTDREASVRGFQRNAYELFSETLYDELPAEQAEEGELFHPGEKDESAPHFPILVDWDERFQEFDPMLRPEDGGATQAQIEGAFGQLIERLLSRLDGDSV